MPKDIFEKPNALTVKPSQRQDLTARSGFEPLAPRPQLPVEITAPPARLSSALQPLEPSRRALDSGSTRRPPDEGTESERASVDPRTYVEEFRLELYCCGRPVELIYDDGRDVTEEEGAPQYMVEFLFHAVCPHCHGQMCLQNIRPMPADFMAR